MENMKLTAINVTDPLAVPQARASRPNLVAEIPTPYGTRLVFHDNPGSSNLPPPGRERKELFNRLKVEEFEPRGSGDVNDGQCQGVTKKGSRCKKDAAEGSKFCNVHQE